MQFRQAILKQLRTSEGRAFVLSLAGMALVCVAGAVVAFTVRPRPAV